jgi:hypothetical protein
VLPALLGHAFQEARTMPHNARAPFPVGKLLTPLVAMRDGLTWVGTEVLWSADIFARLMVSVVVPRAVTRLTTEWFFPREIWNQSDQILKGFAGEEETPPVGERPRLIHEQAGWRFYQHRQQYQGQTWVCPLLKPEPCPQCEWFVPRVTTAGIGAPPSRKSEHSITTTSKTRISTICATNSSGRTEIGAAMPTA